MNIQPFCHTRNICFLRPVIFCYTLCLLLACGGGSVGTGSRIISGNISDESGTPVALALVTIEQTGDQGRTNQDGDFEIMTMSDQANLSLLVESDGIEDKVTVDDANRAERTSVDLQIDKSNRTIRKVRSLSVTAKIVGKCDAAFENNATIRQSNQLANGTECTLKVSIFGDGRPLGDIPFVLQHRECDDSKKWRDEATGLTKVLTTPGIAQLNFSYKTDPAHCDYRVIAPYKSNGLKEVIFPIVTFQRQAK